MYGENLRQNFLQLLPSRRLIHVYKGLGFHLIDPLEIIQGCFPWPSKKYTQEWKKFDPIAQNLDNWLNRFLTTPSKMDSLRRRVAERLAVATSASAGSGSRPVTSYSETNLRQVRWFLLFKSRTKTFFSTSTVFLKFENCYGLVTIPIIIG